MPRDELNEPLRRRSLWARVRARRPSAAGRSRRSDLPAHADRRPLAHHQPQSLCRRTRLGPRSAAGNRDRDRLHHPANPVAEPAPAPTQEPEPADTEEIVIDQSPRPPRSPGNLLAGRFPDHSERGVDHRLAAPLLAAGAHRRRYPGGAVWSSAADRRGGKKPSTVYARTTSASIQMSDAPKIAIILGGMGLNAELTARQSRRSPAK